MTQISRSFCVVVVLVAFVQTDALRKAAKDRRAALGGELDGDVSRGKSVDGGFYEEWPRQLNADGQGSESYDRGPEVQYRDPRLYQSAQPFMADYVTTNFSWAGVDAECWMRILLIICASCTAMALHCLIDPVFRMKRLHAREYPDEPFEWEVLLWNLWMKRHGNPTGKTTEDAGTQTMNTTKARSVTWVVQTASSLTTETGHSVSVDSSFSPFGAMNKRKFLSNNGLTTICEDDFDESSFPGKTIRRRSLDVRSLRRQVSVGSLGSAGTRDSADRLTTPVGIDVGTTSIRVALWDRRVGIGGGAGVGVRVIHSEPACVLFGAGRLTGEAAKMRVRGGLEKLTSERDHVLRDVENAAINVRRMIGRRFPDNDLVQDTKIMPFKITTCDGDDGVPQMQIPLDGSVQSMYFEQVLAIMLMSVQEGVMASLGADINNCVLTVPASFNDLQRRAVLDAAAIAGINVIRLVNEPTAALLEYGMSTATSKQRVLLAWTMGSGTFDCSAVQVRGGTYDVLCTSGDSHFGGVDFDDRLLAHCMEQCKEQLGSCILETDRVAQERVRLQCEKAKHDLSSKGTATIFVPNLNGQDFELEVDSNTFSQICQDLLRTVGDHIGRVALDSVTGRAKKIHHQLQAFCAITDKLREQSSDSQTVIELENILDRYVSYLPVLETLISEKSQGKVYTHVSDLVSALSGTEGMASGFDPSTLHEMQNALGQGYPIRALEMMISKIAGFIQDLPSDRAILEKIVDYLVHNSPTIADTSLEGSGLEGSDDTACDAALTDDEIDDINKLLQDLERDQLDLGSPAEPVLIDEVVMFGGCARIPELQSVVQKYFQPASRTVRIVLPSPTSDGGEAVMGAAVLAATCGGYKVPRFQELKDVISQSLGIANAQGTMVPIIPRNEGLPFSNSCAVVTYEDDQEDFDGEFYQGENPLADQNSFLGLFVLGGLPPGPRGKHRAAFTAKVDESGLFRLFARLLTSDEADASNITLTEHRFQLQLDDLGPPTRRAPRVKPEDAAAERKYTASTYLWHSCNAVLTELSKPDVQSRLKAADRETVTSAANSVLEWYGDHEQMATVHEIHAKQMYLEEQVDPIMALHRFPFRVHCSSICTHERSKVHRSDIYPLKRTKRTSRASKCYQELASIPVARHRPVFKLPTRRSKNPRTPLSSEKMMPAVPVVQMTAGIDIGTQNIRVAIWKREGRCEVVHTDPALGINLGLTTASGLVGKDASDALDAAFDLSNDQGGHELRKAVFNIKRLIGRKYPEPYLLQDTEALPFDVFFDEKDGNPRVEIQGDRRTMRWHMEQVLSTMLRKIVQKAETIVQGQIVDVVLTVPACFNESQRLSMKDVALYAGLNVLRLLSEPTSAAIARGLHQKQNQQTRHICVWSMGAGHFDCSMVLLRSGSFEVLATCGASHLGGNDVVELLLAHCLRIFGSNNRGAPVKPGSVARLRRALEVVKRDLAEKGKISFEVPGFFLGAPQTFELDIEILVKLTLNMRLQIRGLIQRLVVDSHVPKESVSEVVMVGGSATLPGMREMVSEIFNGRVRVTVDDNSMDAAVVGAAAQAAVLTGFEVKGFKTAVDVLPLTIGIVDRPPLSPRGRGGNAENFSALVPRNAQLPFTIRHPIALPKDQDQYTFDIIQGENASPEDNYLLGSFVLSDFPAGSVDYELNANVTEDGILELSVMLADAAEGDLGNLSFIEQRVSDHMVDITSSKSFDESGPKTPKGQKKSSRLLMHKRLTDP